MSEGVQLELPLKQANVLDFVSKMRQSYLDYSVQDIMRKSPGLANAARLVSQKGVFFVGDLLSQQRGFLTHVVGLSESEVIKLDCLLSKGGLHLEMSIPYWCRPNARSA
jgi:hypothetical protein